MPVSYSINAFPCLQSLGLRSCIPIIILQMLVLLQKEDMHEFQGTSFMEDRAATYIVAK